MQSATGVSSLQFECERVGNGLFQSATKRLQRFYIWQILIILIFLEMWVSQTSRDHGMKPQFNQNDWKVPTSRKLLDLPMYFVGECLKVVGSVCSVGSLDWVKFPLGAFCQPDKPPCFCLSSCRRNNSGSWFFLCKQRKVQDSSLAAGHTVAMVDSMGIGITKGEMLCICEVPKLATGINHIICSITAPAY